MVPTVRRLPPTWLQRTARFTGLAVVLMLIEVAVGQGGPPNPLTQPPAVMMEFGLLIVMTLGLLAAWRWELAGALAAIGAWVGFNLIEMAVNHKPAGGALPLFIIPALLHLLDVALRRQPIRAAGRRHIA